MRVIGATPDLQVDMRLKAADSTTSLAKKKSPDADGTVAVLVENEDYEGNAAIIVVVTSDGAIRAQMPTIVGG